MYRGRGLYLTRSNEREGGASVDDTGGGGEDGGGRAVANALVNTPVRRRGGGARDGTARTGLVEFNR